PHLSGPTARPPSGDVPFPCRDSPDRMPGGRTDRGLPAAGRRHAATCVGGPPVWFPLSAVDADRPRPGGGSGWMNPTRAVPPGPGLTDPGCDGYRPARVTFALAALSTPW